MAEDKPAWIVNVDDHDFERVVLHPSHDKPVVVDFWAPWCGPCLALTPVLEKVLGEHNGAVVLAKVNIDESPMLASKFQIQSIPLVIGFRGGKPVAEFEGVYPEAQVRQFVQQLLPSGADTLAAEAKALEATAAARAESQYREALRQDPHHEAAALGLARVLLARGQEEEALATLLEVGTAGPAGEEAERLRGIAALRQLAKPFGDETALRQRVAQEPKNGRGRYELGTLLAAEQKYAEALEMLLSAAELDPKLASPLVRDAMVKVFHVIGDRSELANDYRNKLSTLLY
jgi:putative thioredoxin